MSSISKITKGMEGKYIAYTILSPVSMIGEVVMESVIPLIMAKIIDKGIMESQFSVVLSYGLLMVGLSVLSLLCGCCGSIFSARASQGFSHNLRRRLFGKVQNFSFANIDKFSSASLVTRLTTDVTNTQNVYRMIIQMCFRAPFMLIAGTIMALKLNARLSVVFAVAIPILAVAITVIGAMAHPLFEKMLKKYDALNARIQENLIGIRVVKAYVRGDFENEKFEKSAADVRKAQMKAEKRIIFLMPIMQMVIYVTIIIVMWLGGREVVIPVEQVLENGEKIFAAKMTVGELTSFITYVTQVLSSLMMIGFIFTGIVLSTASVKRICEVLDEEIDVKNPENPITEVKDGSIDFEDVDFSYFKKKDKLVLKNINLNIKSGQVVGVIGGTGSSKSTFVSLIPRLYDTTEGAVKVGGIDVKKYDLTVLRDSVAMVLQKNVLFSGTIRENLKWGNENATDEEIIAACKAADAHSFIEGFPEGYDTVLGQGGVNVSGGQKQRLCIARALLKKPRILILDDSTSAVDTATEARIRASLKELAPETTKIIIAQRISSVKDADQIIVLDNGTVNGVGTHEELLKSNDIYREVNESQSQGSGDADIE
ncbi:MAG: ABC transporter ATP-binding protein [Treponema sp.]|nr:ABC transporter ATP-binding protein [Treponema sp.]